MYIAHKTEDGRIQSLKEHLENTAKLCSDNAIEQFKDIAYLSGLIHDIGKGCDKWQAYIDGKRSSIPHALCGAIEIHKQPNTMYIPMLEYVVASHHTGLCDGGNRGDSEDMPTLNGILKRKTEDYSGALSEIEPVFPQDPFSDHFKALDKRSGIELFSFFTRYLFSCLTNADFIDTESFCEPDSQRGIKGDFKKAYELICNKIDGIEAKTELQKARGRIQEQVYMSMDDTAKVYIIDMPTGSGKTLCSMKAALKTAIEKNKKRIIYVIPYVSVIEQTAKVFNEIFGDALPVLEHHSNYDFDDPNKKDEAEAESDTTAEKLKKSSENWDAPLIVTTNVQFFESVYHYKSSRLRKLHNMADSVIVFDEVHMLPTDYLQPCIRAIGYITRYLNTTAIIMSATMPDLSNYFMKYTGITELKNLVTDKSDYGLFRKCRYTYIEQQSLESIAFRLKDEHSALIVVNTKKKARDMYKLFDDGGDGIYHLSTNLTVQHRSEKIEEICHRLKKGKKTIVISTSLIEAGVDLDFNTVYRENAGLDNILQAGGRCNREGKLSLGNVYVFDTDGGEKDIKIKSDITKSLFHEYDDVSSEACIKEYYKRMLVDSELRIQRNSITEYMGESLNLYSVPFKSYAAHFNMIDADTIAVVIPCDENRHWISKLEYSSKAKKKLKKYSISVSYRELEDMKKMGIVEEKSGVYMLSNTDYYDMDIGFDIDKELNYIC